MRQSHRQVLAGKFIGRAQQCGSAFIGGGDRRMKFFDAQQRGKGTPGSRAKQKAKAVEHMPQAFALHRNAAGFKTARFLDREFFQQQAAHLRVAHTESRAAGRYQFAHKFKR